MSSGLTTNSCASDMPILPSNGTNIIDIAEQSYSTNPTTLEILLFELPDPNQHLFIQILLTAFILFPQLPLEIRLMIWRESFPGPRRIDIKLGQFPRQTSGLCRPVISLKINQESRSETLKCYHIVFDPTTTDLFRNAPPICLDVTRDTAVVFMFPIMADLKFYPGLKTYANIFQALRHLEIRGANFGSSSEDEAEFERNEGAFLRLFPNLEELQVDVRYGPCGVGIWTQSDGVTEADVARFLEDFALFFRTEVELGRRLSIPKVVIRKPEY